MTSETRHVNAARMYFMRKCKKCGDEKPLDDFPVSLKKDGKPACWRWVCGKCYYQTNTRVQAQRIRDWYYEYKKTLQCERCGIADFRVLEFHHTDPAEKEFDVSQAAISGWGKETLLAEIAKCCVLCANCHRIETWEARNALAA